MGEDEDTNFSEIDERAAPDLKQKMLIVDANALMIESRAEFGRARTQNKWEDFIKKLRNLYGLVKFDFETQIRKSKSQSKDLELCEKYLGSNIWLPCPIMDEIIAATGESIFVMSEYEKAIYYLSNVVSKAPFKAGVTDVKFRRENPIDRIKKSY